MTEYIRRDVAVNGLAKIINESDMPEDWNKGMSAAMLALFRIPAADVRPVVRGRWIWKDNGEVVCSECNDLIAVVGNTEDLETVISGFNFCPNCGADMREES